MYDSTRPIESARCDRSRSANAASDVVDASDAWNASNALSAVASTIAVSVATTLTIHGTTGVIRALPAQVGAGAAPVASTCRTARGDHPPDDRSRARAGCRARRDERLHRARILRATWRFHWRPTDKCRCRRP